MSHDPSDTPTPTRRPAKPLFFRLLEPLASLRLTVVLFALSLVLVFVGTLAQKHAGIWTVVAQYFRSAYVWVPFKIFFFAWPDEDAAQVPGGFPFPGGWLIGTFLLINLMAAHLVRFKLTWKRSGIIILHSGLLVIMLGELITGVYAVEGIMSIDEGDSSNFVTHYTQSELAVVDPSDPKVDDVVAVRGGILRPGRTIKNDHLPFDVEVVKYMANSDVRAPKPDERNPATEGFGKEALAIELPEITGTDPNQKNDFPSAYVTLKDKATGASLGTYMFSTLQKPQTVTVGDKKYEVSLRFARTYKPFTMHLIEARHDTYLGTGVAKNYSSLVRLTDPEFKEDRQVLIRMNDPLRYRGETFYQSTMSSDPAAGGRKMTGLQVVRNPAWLLPYLSCVMVAAGMLIHFGMHLVSFVRRRAAT